eukprot:7433400-Alexandrium_andersonii.AAC.1
MCVVHARENQHVANVTLAEVSVEEPSKASISSLMQQATVKHAPVPSLRRLPAQFSLPLVPSDGDAVVRAEWSTPVGNPHDQWKKRKAVRDTETPDPLPKKRATFKNRHRSAKKKKKTKGAQNDLTPPSCPT